ncbi:LysR family transcriptional regulator [Lichenicola cladoniae]|uniref:LysR family transcriptional regulator n=1 Tax=Lichenicola cladoniae TaxID=1484109 RepID=A0A6M8HST5_9PROT|nr:LysR family transcriptional regulator [Lichenicola cladoniae]NPD65554.1 LysR family transcriptional regulator [Acetobacteraceae bacterium]QKE91402.1 LysR family transcriptional regulator [Lichenicola cladoniae]
MLDLQSVRIFVLVAEHGNMTRAAEAAGTVQPVVSQRIRTLETVLGRKLLNRTPRYVRLTEAGTIFLERARHLLAAHDAAIAPEDGGPLHIALAVSDHTLGTSFDTILRRLRSAVPQRVTFALRLGQSLEVKDLFDRGEVDLAIIRREGRGAEGEVLGEDPIAWCAPSGWRRPEGPLPLVSLPPPCGVRGAALKVLDQASIPWREAFVGGSCLALAAAVRAGLGVAPLGRLVAGGLGKYEMLSDLPALPASQVVMLVRAHSPLVLAAARSLSASVRDTLRST